MEFDTRSLPFGRELCLHDLISESNGDQDQEEKEAEEEDAHRIISSSSFLPQRITKSKFKELGSSGQMFSLVVVFFV